MRVLTRLIFLVIILLFGIALYIGWRYNFQFLDFNRFTVEISQEEIQGVIEQEFPIRRESLGLSLTVSNPKVALKEGSDRIGLVGDSSIGILGLTNLPGQFSIEGRAEIRDKQMILHDFTLVDLTIPQIKSEHKAKALDILNALLDERLNAQPIAFGLSERIQQRIDRYNIKSMSIKNGRIEIVVEPI